VGYSIYADVKAWTRWSLLTAMPYPYSMAVLYYKPQHFFLAPFSKILTNRDGTLAGICRCTEYTWVSAESRV